MSTFPMQSAPNHSHFFPSAPSPAPSTSHYPFPQYWYTNSANTTSSFATPSSSPAKRKRDGSFDDQDSSSSDDGGPNYNPSAHRGSHATLNSSAQRGGASAAAPPQAPARPVKRVRREWTSSTDDGSPTTTTGLGGTRPAGMENGFARMTLLNRQTADPPVFVQEPMPIQRNEQPVKEVHMKTRSWYEPEKDRIVVLDLDGSDTESDSTPDSSSYPSRSSTQSPVDETMTGNARSGYTISQAYLSRVKGVPKPPNMNPYQPGSLILYKHLSNLDSDSVVEPLDDSHPNYVLPNWGPIPMEDDRPLYATIEEVDDDEDIQMMEVDGN